MIPLQSLSRLLDSIVLTEISSVADQFNIFEAIGMANQEIRHSTFLSFLLNPAEAHGLGETLLRGFLRSVFDDSPPERADSETWRLGDARVDREWNFIDIRIRLPTERVVIVIENKVWTGEHSDQLARYYNAAQSHHTGWRIVPVYLTPGGSAPSDSRYKAVRYSAVVALIEEVLSAPRFTDMNSDSRVLLHHYVQLIRRNIVGGSELEELCKKIYLEHRDAIDLINKYRPDTQNDMRQLIEDLVGNTEGVLILPPIRDVKVSEYRKYCMFIPEKWNTLVPNTATEPEKWRWTTRICNFVVVNLPTDMYILLQLRPGSEQDRQHFYQIAEAAGFVSGPRIAKYQELRRWNLLTPADFRTTTPSTLHEIVRKGWNDFVTDELPQVVDVFRIGLSRQTF